MVEISSKTDQINGSHPKTGFDYEILFEISSDLLCIAGYDGYFRKINQAVSNLLGYTMEELYSRPIHEFIYEEDKVITARLRDELLKQKPLLHFENRYVTKSGDIVWLSWTSHPVPKDQLIFAIAKDVTHKKAQEAERNALLAKLNTLNNELKQLNYTTSHDLRSPVNNLLSIIDLIDVSKIEDKETIELINYLKLSGESLNQTLNAYVDSLNEKHNDGKTPEQVDLKISLDDVLLSIRSLVKASGLSINIDFSGAEKVCFNKSYMDSVFLNLLTNSIKYARPGIAPVVNIHSKRIGEFVQLVVEDNGLGFDMEKVKDKIFGLHQKFHDHSDSKGIGLYLISNHITSLGGKIEVESKVNEGTRFRIQLKA